ncbi:MAG TPA: type II toxin-antitoxin system VapB family antitoxin [Ilumatobacteraceae bacterium]|jgi:antitoxin VapB|nr:type II toxin-antitoxin system VapB family antitoxin [Ilumatobacteraceae bacterium]
MALSIKSDEADRLARELAAVTGESITVAVTEAIRMRLATQRRARRGLARRLMAISEASSRLPRLDDRTDDEILGYDEDGLPG